jgi:hypothetical protein
MWREMELKLMLYLSLRFPNAAPSLRFRSIRFDSSLCIYCRRMPTNQHTAFTLLDIYDILYGGHKSNAGVGSGRRRRFFSLTWISLLHNVVKRVRNRTERFRCVFGGIDSNEV